MAKKNTRSTKQTRQARKIRQAALRAERRAASEADCNRWASIRAAEKTLSDDVGQRFPRFLETFLQVMSNPNLLGNVTCKVGDNYGNVYPVLCVSDDFDAGMPASLPEWAAGSIADALSNHFHVGPQSTFAAGEVCFVAVKSRFAPRPDLLMCEKDVFSTFDEYCRLVNPYEYKLF